MKAIGPPGIEYGLLIPGFHNLNAMARTAALAMQDDPLFIHFFPDPRTRSRGITSLCTLLCAIAVLSGDACVSSAACEGVAIWEPPGHSHMRGMRRLTMPVMRFIAAVGLLSIARMIRHFVRALCIKKKLVPEPHWYLMLVAVDPSYQGRGLASRLMKPTSTWAFTPSRHCASPPASRNGAW
jgi:GNAT superfamily N-acetyltransferase